MFDLIVSIVYALGIIWFGPTKISLLLCAITASLIRLRYDHASTIRLSAVAVCLILLVDSVMIGIDLPANMYSEFGPNPPYYVLLVPAIAWVVHLPLGLLAARLSVVLLEFGARRVTR